MILISKSYTEITPESAENGEFSNTGFVYANCEFTFSELVRELREYSETSSYPCYGSKWDWVSTNSEIDDYSTMTERSESLHFSHLNPERKTKYWRKALQLAGLAK